MRPIVRVLTAAALALLASTGITAAQDYTFEGGYPTAETVRKAYDEADLNRAVRAYRFFYPTVSSAAIWNENLRIGVVPNRASAISRPSRGTSASP